MNQQEQIEHYANEIIEVLFGSLSEGGPGSGNWGHGGRKGKRGGSLPGSGDDPHIKFSMHSKSKYITAIKMTNPGRLVELRNKLSKERQKSLHAYTAREYTKEKIKTFIDPTKTYGLKGKDEIVSVMSSQKGMGKFAVMQAIINGGKRLDCFDTGLPQYYNQFGFKEVKREPNWTPGKPDNVYMEWKP